MLILDFLGKLKSVGVRQYSQIGLQGLFAGSLADLFQNSFLSFYTQQPIMRELHISQKVDSLMVFRDDDLVGVQFKLKLFFEKNSYFLEPFLKWLKGVVDQYEVIGISQIKRHFEAAFYVLVQFV